MKRKKTSTILILCIMSMVTLPMDAKSPQGQRTGKVSKKEQYADSIPTPTLSEVAYGSHERHVLDFWKAKSDKPTPLVFVIHGGGWSGGSKERLSRFVDAPALLKAGISVVAINYRYIHNAQGLKPPVKAPLFDAARALQFVRSKAAEWNIDKTHIAAAGSSAGACTSLWLLYHDDLADPESDDPIARESTRL
ncbi:MAG: alpha/beta hydrolase, partial [Opitutae bacterium]|nr:alpha/beta hydrolase [Opitutae bacterium]